MTNDLPTLMGRRRIAAEQVIELERAGAYPAAGIVVAGRAYAATDLLRVLDHLPHAYLDTVTRQLNAAEDAQFHPTA